MYKQTVNGGLISKFYNHDYKTLQFWSYIYILVFAGSPALAFRGSAEGDETAHRCKRQPTREKLSKTRPNCGKQNRVAPSPNAILSSYTFNTSAELARIFSHWLPAEDFYLLYCYQYVKMDYI